MGAKCEYDSNHKKFRTISILKFDKVKDPVWSGNMISLFDESIQYKV